MLPSISWNLVDAGEEAFMSKWDQVWKKKYLSLDQ